MVKITTPLMSMKASGSIAKFLTFSERKSGSQTRWQKKQKRSVASVLQSQVQAMYNLASARWLAFSTAEKLVYNNLAKASKKSLSGWNYFYKMVKSCPYTYLGIVYYFIFNKQTSNKIIDQSGNNYEITLLPTYPTTCPTLVSSRTVKMQKALQFANNQQNARIPYISAFNTNNVFTFCFWAKLPTMLSGVGSFITRSPDVSVYGPYLYPVFATRKLAFGQFFGVSNTVESDTIIPVDEWVHIAVTVNQRDVYFYFNGKPDAKKTLNNAFYANIQPIYLAGYVSPNFLNFTIDEFIYYNRVLSATEIKAIYNQKF